MITNVNPLSPSKMSPLCCWFLVPPLEAYLFLETSPFLSFFSFFKACLDSALLTGSMASEPLHAYDQYLLFLHLLPYILIIPIWYLPPAPTQTQDFFFFRQTYFLCSVLQKLSKPQQTLSK